MSTTHILACTVGGSHQPIISAYSNLNPDFVCFICSEADPGTKKPGSATMVTGKGLFLKASAADDKATLPNIPTQLGLEESAFMVITVPADDLDGATHLITIAFSKLRDTFPGAHIVADYTGGTKTMTAALVIATLEADGIDLQLVTGNRTDLVKVSNGTERSSLANIDGIRLQRAMAPFLYSWQHFAYSEAADGLSTIKSPANRILSGQLGRAHDLSQAFAAWDRFDHSEARRLLLFYAEVIKNDLGKHLGALKDLTEQSAKQTPLRLFDLWRNAERRAAQSRYDDAVARVYRLLEWSAQWLLEHHCQIKTGDLQPEQLPIGIHIAPDPKGKLKVGLFVAWQLIEKLTQGPACQFATTQLPALKGHVEGRNSSILAHGFIPVSQRTWEQLSHWIEAVFLPMLLEETKAVGVYNLPPQLPGGYMWNQ